MEWDKFCRHRKLLPCVQIVILSSPAPKQIRKTIDLLKIFSLEGTYTSENPLIRKSRTEDIENNIVKRFKISFQYYFQHSYSFGCGDSFRRVWPNFVVKDNINHLFHLKVVGLQLFTAAIMEDLYNALNLYYCTSISMKDKHNI